MKVALFALGFLTFAQGIHLEEGNSNSMDVEFDYEREREGCCIAPPCGEPQRNFCQGFVEIRTEFNGIETVHGRINKQYDPYNIQLEEGSSMDVEFDHDEDFENGGPIDKASKLRYRPIGGRNARKIIEVQGNCCWRFYQR